jgi:type VI secretion system lysozyme-like protein
MAAGSKQTSTRLERSLQRALEVFEPRLINVTVKAVEGEDKEKKTIRFLISGWLHMSPAPLQVSFDTRLQLARGEYRVVGD